MIEEQHKLEDAVGADAAAESAPVRGLTCARGSFAELNPLTLMFDPGIGRVQPYLAIVVCVADHDAR